MKRVPEGLAPLVEQGLIEEVVRPLMSGKEAQVFLVVAGGCERAAKVYKDAERRAFKHRSQYTEGRRVRSSRDRRAMEKGSRYGREQAEASWRSVEVDHVERLHAAGVRVPVPHGCFDGVFLMELVCDTEGRPAPRLADVEYGPEAGREAFHFLLGQVAQMLLAGVVHGDLSPFNVLVDAQGPVIIDFPQAVDAAHNTHARDLFVRDVRNLTDHFHSELPAAERKQLRFGEEIWALYEAGTLDPRARFTGRWQPPKGELDPQGVLDDIEYFERLEAQRRGLPLRPELRGEAEHEGEATHDHRGRRGSRKSKRRGGRKGRK